MTKEKLILEAKRRYPIGTVFLEATNGEEKYTVKKFDDDLGRGGWYSTNCIIVHVRGGTVWGKYLYFNGKWADIIKYPKGWIKTVNCEIY